jgi:hypothetical protein
MAFKDSSSRKAYFAGMRAKEKQLKEEGFTSNPELDVKGVEKLLPKLPKMKFPKIKNLMKVPKK